MGSRAHRTGGGSRPSWSSPAGDASAGRMHNIWRDYVAFVGVGVFGGRNLGGWGRVLRSARPKRERERRLALHSGNDPSAGSPTETLLRLLLPSSEKIQPASHAHRRWLPSSCGAVRGFHRFAQSVAATGGVYKGQGRIQRALMRRAYKAFLVDDQQFQWSIPSTTGVQRLPTPIGAG